MKKGPGRKVKSPCAYLVVHADDIGGHQIGRKWIRLKSTPSEHAMVLASVVLPVPGRSPKAHWPLVRKEPVLLHRSGLPMITD